MNTDYTPTSTPRSDVSMHRLSDSQSSVSTVPSTSETPRSLGTVLYSYNSIVAAVDLAATTLFCLVKEEVEKHPQAQEFVESLRNLQLEKPSSECQSEILVLVERCTVVKTELSKIKQRVVQMYENAKSENQNAVVESRRQESEMLYQNYIELCTPHRELLEEIQPLYTALRKDYRESNEHTERRLTHLKRNFIRNQKHKFIELEKNYQNALNTIVQIDDRYLIELTLLEEKYREIQKSGTRPLRRTTRKIVKIVEEVDLHIGEIIEAANEVLKTK